MEEFRSTEILDKEIQDDARRKAVKILQKSESEGKKILEDAENRIAAMKEEKDSLYNRNIKNYKDNLDASLPLEKERFLVSFEDSAVMTAINEYIKSLSVQKKEELICKLLKRYKEIFSGKKLTVYYHGFEEQSIKNLITDVFEKISIDSIRELSDFEASEIGGQDGVIIETEGKVQKCRATLHEIMHDIVDCNRFELANTLFCGRLEA